MFRKLITWCGNIFLACVLVSLYSQNVVFAQSGETTEQSQAISGPNGGNEEGRILVPLTGTATSKRVEELQISPVKIDTGVVQVGDSKTETVTLRHIGSDDALPIEINSASFFGKNSSEYSTDFVGFISLMPGEEVNFDIIFTPTIPGTKSAGLRLEIEGSTSPYVLLFEGWSRYPLTSDLGINSDKIEFGQVIQGENSTAKFTLTNNGEAEAPEINIWNVDILGDTPDAFDVKFDSTKLEPGESVDIQVVMSGATIGSKGAEIKVNHDGNNAALSAKLNGNVVQLQNVPVNFGKSTLNNAEITRGTTIQFGPDGKLYVGEMSGYIKVFDVVRNGKNSYSADLVETIDEIHNVPNHNDDGKLNTKVKSRLLTGIYITGTAESPIIYAASSDPRQAAGPSGKDANLDTNSGILHRLTKDGGGWKKQDLVRGLPRSEENHVSNGLLMYNGKILLNTGGHTNMGMPSNNFAELTEYALSSAILEIDVNAIGNGTYDLPTLDDEDRAGTNDENDPFGGNDGKNQAKLVKNGPVKLFATGFRNIFDITMTESGRIYTFDNGPNAGWGGMPKNNCKNEIDNVGLKRPDSLHLVTKGFHGGHPNPTRGNKDNKFNDSNPQSPVEIDAHAIECDYKEPGQGNGAITTIIASSNGLDEYTASNFAGAMKGELLVASFNKAIYRIALNNDGNKLTSKSELIKGLGTVPLDLTTRGDNDSFSGTIWVIDNIESGITVLEPADY